MKKTKSLVFGFLLISLFILVIGVAIIIVQRQTRIFYVASELGIKAWNWEDVEVSFKNRFPPGTSRSDVNTILVRIDPSLSQQLTTDSMLDCPGDCCETFFLFKERLGRGFGHVFCYDEELKLRYVTLSS